MQLIEAYFDESSTENDPKLPEVLAVAGYLYESDSARRLTSEWRPLLISHQLDYFGMADCNKGHGDFNKYDDRQRDAIQRQFFEVLKANAPLCGVAASIELAHSDALPSYLEAGIEVVSPYTLLCYWCLELARSWILENDFEGEVAYFFENGHDKETEAAKAFRKMFSSPFIRQKFMHGSDTFRDKRKWPLLQTADILAWQYRRHETLRVAGKLGKRRADFESLLDIPLRYTHFDASVIQIFLEDLKNQCQRNRVIQNAASGEGF